MDAKKNKLPLIIIIPIIGGIALLISGIVSGIEAIIAVGIAVLFGGSFLFAVIIVIYAIVTGVRSDTPTSANEEKPKADAISEIHDRADGIKGGASTKAEETHAKEDANAQNRKRTDRNAKVFVGLFLTFFILFPFVGIGLLCSSYMVAGGIVFACGPAMIILLLIVTKIKERKSLSYSKRTGEKFTRKVGCVTRCVLSSSIGTRTVYRVEVQVDGIDRTAYSRDRYDNGDMVEVNMIGNSSIVSIIGRAECNNTDDDNISINAEADPLFNARNGNDETIAIGYSINDVKETESGKNDQAQELTVARRALIVALDKLKTVSAEVENTQEEYTNNTATAIAIDTEHSSSTRPVIISGSAVREQKDAPDERAENNETQTAGEHRNYGAAPLNKRTTITYKGINRKK